MRNILCESHKGKKEKETNGNPITLLTEQCCGSDANSLSSTCHPVADWCCLSRFHTLEGVCDFAFFKCHLYNRLSVSYDCVAEGAMKGHGAALNVTDKTFGVLFSSKVSTLSSHLFARYSSLRYHTHSEESLQPS